jgi:hypothetical protein
MAEIPRPHNPLGWTGQMRDELGRLPETAANIREASENLKQVSEQLIDVTAMLQRVVRTMDATGVSGSLDRIEQVARDLDGVRRMMVPPRNLDEAAQRIDDVVTGLRGMATRPFTGGRPAPAPRPPADPGPAEDPDSPPDPPATTP